MSKKLKIVAVVGSLRQHSYNRAAVLAAKEVAPSEVTIELADISNIPGFNEDQENNLPSAVVEFKRQIKEADAVLIATQEYNYSIPGVLKNAIDWATRPYGQSVWPGKPGAIIGASVGGIATARAQYHLRQICVNLNVLLMNQPEVMIGAASSKFDESGRLTDQPTREHLKKFMNSFVQWIELVSKKS
jgi:chromate reductase